MAHVTADRILESTTTTGIGAIALVGAVTGFRRFSAECAIGDTVPYFIEAIDSLGMPTGDYEYGIGTYSAANTLTRTKVEGSSNGGAAVNFAAGSKNVGIPAMASGQVPTGMLGEFLGTTPPVGWLERDGSLVSRLQYPALWAHAQAGGAMAVNDVAWFTDKGKFSPGDGATTFRLPDHRGYHTRAWDHGAGVDAGRGLASLQGDAIPTHGHTGTVAINEPPHRHGITFNNSGGGGMGNLGAPAIANGGTNQFGALFTDNATIGITATVAINNYVGGATETRVKTVAVLACIKT